MSPRAVEGGPQRRAEPVQAGSRSLFKSGRRGHHQHSWTDMARGKRRLDMSGYPGSYKGLRSRETDPRAPFRQGEGKDYLSLSHHTLLEEAI